MRRIVVELDDDVFNRMNEILPWGTKASVIRKLLDLAVSGAAKCGPEYIGALLTGYLELTIKRSKEQEDE